MSEVADRPLSDPDFRAGVLDLLGALAYGELVAFFTIVRDAEGAPDISLRMKLADVAVTEHQQYQRLIGRIEELGGDPGEVMTPFATSFNEWHERTAPSDWTESVMKLYAGSSLARDFYREIARFVDPQTHALVNDVLDHASQVEFAAATLGEQIAKYPQLGGRLALYGRRIMGEALSQAQRVAADREAMTALLVDFDGVGQGADLAELTRMFARITEAHTARMEALGLSS
ncbi:ferritin-like fold-containing protein [Dermacoccaceae bacterium W4C1]